MLVLPLRKIFVPRLVEIGPVAVSYTHLDVYKRQGYRHRPSSTLDCGAQRKAMRVGCVPATQYHMIV